MGLYFVNDLKIRPAEGRYSQTGAQDRAGSAREKASGRAAAKRLELGGGRYDEGRRTMSNYKSGTPRSGVPGISWHAANGNWVVRQQVKASILQFLGSFDDLEDARRVLKEVKRCYCANPSRDGTMIPPLTYSDRFPLPRPLRSTDEGDPVWRKRPLDGRAKGAQPRKRPLEFTPRWARSLMNAPSFPLPPSATKHMWAQRYRRPSHGHFLSAQRRRIRGPLRRASEADPRACLAAWRYYGGGPRLTVRRPALGDP